VDNSSRLYGQVNCGPLSTLAGLKIILNKLLFNKIFGTNVKNSKIMCTNGIVFVYKYINNSAVFHRIRKENADLSGLLVGSFDP